MGEETKIKPKKRTMKWAGKLKILKWAGLKNLTYQIKNGKKKKVK